MGILSSFIYFVQVADNFRAWSTKNVYPTNHGKHGLAVSHIGVAFRQLTYFAYIRRHLDHTLMRGLVDRQVDLGST